MSFNISVIIPVYNRAKFLSGAVNSVLSQPYCGIELIVVDDGSTDNPEGSLSKYADNRLKIVKQQNKGVSAARNYGVSVSKYDWVAFLDSDDIWMPEKLNAQVAAMLENPAFRISYTGENWIRNGQCFLHKKAGYKFSGNIFEQCLSDCFIGCSTVLMEKSLFYESGGFDESLPVCEDYDLWLKISSKYPILLVERPLINKIGGHDCQLSKKYWGNDRFRVQSIINIIKSGKLDCRQIELACKKLAEKCLIIAGGSLKRANYKDFSFYLSLLLSKPVLEHKKNYDK